MNDLIEARQNLRAYALSDQEIAEAQAKDPENGLIVDKPQAVKDSQEKASESGEGKKSGVKSTVKATAKTVDKATSLIPKAKDVPVPKGGVGLLLTIALIIVLAINTAPGQSVSRLMLIWKAVIGKASLGDSSQASTPAPTLGNQWAPGSQTPAIGNTQSGTMGNQWGGGFY